VGLTQTGTNNSTVLDTGRNFSTGPSELITRMDTRCHPWFSGVIVILVKRSTSTLVRRKDAL